MFKFGIDWSEQHHNLCIRNIKGAIVSQVELKHTLAGFERLDYERRKLGVPACECLVAIETAYNLLVDFLLDRGYRVYLIPPQATRGYRNRQRSTDAHTGDSDAALLSSILHTDLDSHHRLKPNSALTQQILAQVRLIDLLGRSIQRQANQLRAVLFRVYPQPLGLFIKLTSQISLHFLMAYPSPQEAQALTRTALENFCREHRYGRTGLISRRYAQLMDPDPQASPAAMAAYRDQIRILAELLLPQVLQRTEALSYLAQLFSQHPDAHIFDSLPGAADLLAPALLAKFGDHRDRFPTPASVQALARTCPVTKKSGKREIVISCEAPRDFRMRIGHCWT